MARKITAKEGPTHDDIKRDARELAAIAIDDKVPIRRISNLVYTPKVEIERQLELDLNLSDVTGINQISKRFVDKLRSLLPVYEVDEKRNLMLECVYLIVEDIIERKTK